MPVKLFTLCLQNRFERLFFLRRIGTFQETARLCYEPNLYNLPGRRFISCVGYKDRTLLKLSQLKLPISRICPMASSVGDEQNVNYEQLVRLINSGNITVVDVREKDEIKETGKIPGSFNIPVGEVSQAFTQLSNEEFEKRYGFSKPTHTDPIVFSCRSGKRSLMALSEAVKAGYVSALNFTGGWLAWEENINKK